MSYLIPDQRTGGYESWKDYCLDLTDTDLYKNLTDQSLAVKGEDGKAYGIPYTVETYGIIYNNADHGKIFCTGRRCCKEHG